MPHKKLLTLHEAIVISLISRPGRISSFEETATFIKKRNLYPERKGRIPLSKQIMLRSLKSNGAYHHLFEQIDENTIRLKNI